MANIWDVAKLAGVSKSTVSRVITKGSSVKSETRQQVEDAIKELNYSPSYFAQGIRSGKTKTIAMLVPDNSNVFYTEMFNGVEQVMLEHNYMTLICNTMKSSSREINYAKSLVKRNIDGIIYNTYKQNKKNLEYFLQLSESIPIIFMDNIVPQDVKAAYVFAEGKSATKNAVNYLYGKGCRRIAYIRVPPSISVINNRYEGYKQGVIECGIKFDEKLVYSCNENDIFMPHIDIGMNGAKYFMSLENPPDAIMASIDTMAIGAMKYLKSAGYDIPGDVKVIGFDNIDLCTLIEPTLTTIAQPIQALGTEAANILIKKIRGEVNIKEQVVFETELIIRGST